MRGTGERAQYSSPQFKENLFYGEEAVSPNDSLNSLTIGCFQPLWTTECCNFKVPYEEMKATNRDTKVSRCVSIWRTRVAFSRCRAVARDTLSTKFQRLSVISETSWCMCRDKEKCVKWRLKTFSTRHACACSTDANMQRYETFVQYSTAFRAACYQTCTLYTSDMHPIRR